ncbi:hypothetical protein, partial [uncultured Ruegeria sp.]|uniref:hypothetical protein n=1 Tax=uncultured Ruegeria sp. TaxID=259304 RepID=UPI00262BF233
FYKRPQCPSSDKVALIAALGQASRHTAGSCQRLGLFGRRRMKTHDSARFGSFHLQNLTDERAEDIHSIRTTDF